MKSLSLNHALHAFKASAIIIFAVVIGINPAHSLENGAFDSKEYPGSVCRDATRSTFRDAATYTDMGIVMNNHSRQVLRVVCPIIRDNTYNNAGIAATFIYYKDNNPSEEIACQVISRRLNGIRFDASQRVRSSGTRTGTLVLKNADAVKARSGDGSFYVQCDIPPKPRNGTASMITAISVTENP